MPSVPSVPPLKLPLWVKTPTTPEARRGRPGRNWRDMWRGGSDGGGGMGTRSQQTRTWAVILRCVSAKCVDLGQGHEE